MRDAETDEVVPDLERAPLVLAMYQRYATGQESDRTIAAWLNAKGRGSRAQLRRYQCGTRRRGGDCDQAIVKAQPLEDQLVEWLRDFRPDSDLRQLVVDAIHAEARSRAGDEPDRRRQLLSQLERLQDLYVMAT